jgi:hypothetical protein
MDDSGVGDTTGCEIFKTSAAAIFLSWSFGDKCPLPSDVRSTFPAAGFLLDEPTRRKL